MVKIQSKGQVNDRVRFIAMEDGRIWYIFPKIESWIQDSGFIVDAIPHLEIYPNGERECSIRENALSSEDLQAALTHWESLR